MRRLPVACIALGLLLLTLSSHAVAQTPSGLAASALADTTFQWVRESVPGFRVYFLRDSYPLANRDSLIAGLSAALADARSLIGAPPLSGPIDVFFIESREQMKALTGAPVTGFADTGAQAVFLVNNSTWRAFERHEIMHVVAARTWGVIGRANPWLQEGLAQAADGFCAGYTNLDMAIALARRHGWIDLDTMLTRFREQRDLRAYLQAASFVEFLLRHAGVAAVRDLWLTEPTANSVLGGRTLARWEEEWRVQAKPTSEVAAAQLNEIEASGCGIH